VSLFQCEECGCIENTACACQGFKGFQEDWFDWSGIEDRKGKLLCSACGPAKFRDGEPTEYGKWHGEFKRKYLPLGLFKTSKNGNLEHKETGDTEYVNYLLNESDNLMK
jgi:hypothetical protein